MQEVSGGMYAIQSQGFMVSLGSEATILSSEIIAIHNYSSGQHLDLKCNPHGDSRSPRCVVLTTRGLTIPCYVTQRTLLKRLGVQTSTPVSSAGMELLSDNTRDDISILRERVRKAMLSDVSDDAKRICQNVLDDLESIVSI